MVDAIPRADGTQIGTTDGSPLPLQLKRHRVRSFTTTIRSALKHQHFVQRLQVCQAKALRAASQAPALSHAKANAFQLSKTLVSRSQ